MQMFPQLSAEDALWIYPDVDETLVRASWPSTLDEAVVRLIDSMDEADKARVRDTKKKDLILFTTVGARGSETSSDCGEATRT